ncbi:14990_t:CDS:2 [Dentiscutata erythropus]|uniref:14990_t:CDS:1 n=1 Tax=Dentiscutata erythropus TaxID=1348616 RepID=A0A9N9JTP7_9GLOM|nr:14990_t:CDS:2 [Dentiscutata erythropus]
MTRTAEYKRHLRSNTFDIEKASIIFLEGHVKYLQRKYRRQEIKINELESRLKDFKKLKEDVRKLKNQIDSLLNVNEALRNKSADLSSVIDYGFNLTANSVKNAELTIFFRKMKKLFETYQNKYNENQNEYEIDIGSLRISEIIDNVKWKELISNNTILAEICSYLTPKDLFSLTQVEKLLFGKLQDEYYWKISRQQQPNYNHKCPIHMTEQQYCFLNFMCQRCQFCRRSDFSLILELKTKICSECREQVLISRFEIEEENRIPSELFPAFHSVDYAQLDGRYLDYSVLHYLKSEVYDTFDEYLKIPQNEKQEWLNKKSRVVSEYYNDVLRIKHQNITNQYLSPEASLHSHTQLTRLDAFWIP